MIGTDREGKMKMAIATLSREEQKKLLKHGHFDDLEIGVYRIKKPGHPFPTRGKPESVTVECGRCGEVLVELIGGREQEG